MIAPPVSSVTLPPRKIKFCMVNVCVFTKKWRRALPAVMIVDDLPRIVKLFDTLTVSTIVQSSVRINEPALVMQFQPSSHVVPVSMPTEACMKGPEELAGHVDREHSVPNEVGTRSVHTPL